MFIDYENQDTKIKHKLLTKMPLKVSECGYKHIDTFINMSPGLIEVQQSNNLTVVIHPTSVMFLTDSQESLTRFKDAWTANAAVANPIHFAEKIDEMDQQEPKVKSTYPYVRTKRKSRLTTLLDQLHGNENIKGSDLRSISKKIYKKRKKGKDEKDER